MREICLTLWNSLINALGKGTLIISTMFILKISAKRCSLYTSFYGKLFNDKIYLERKYVCCELQSTIYWQCAVCAKMFSMNYKKYSNFDYRVSSMSPAILLQWLLLTIRWKRSSTSSFPKMEFYHTNVENE